jgi:RNA polymerase sigma-70 factor (ECF subfamily)
MAVDALSTLGLIAGDAAEVEAAGAKESVGLFERMLLRRLQRGDARAFRELVGTHQDRVYSLCLRMLGQAQEAEDVSQEVFVAVHRHLPRFRGECRLSTWIYRVAKNRCLNRLKSMRLRATEAHDVDVHEANGPSEAHGTGPARPDDALLGAEERAQVHRALATLSDDHRLLVVLRDIEGMSYEEIEKITDLAEGTVKSRLHRARAALADALERAGMAPSGSGRGEG